MVGQASTSELWASIFQLMRNILFQLLFVSEWSYITRGLYDETHPRYKLSPTHCGRRTFICNALMLGILPEIVMKWTGHSDYKAMKPYIAITDKAKRKAMDLFNKKRTKKSPLSPFFSPYPM